MYIKRSGPACLLLRALQQWCNVQGSGPQTGGSLNRIVSLWPVCAVFVLCVPWHACVQLKCNLLR